MDSGETSFAINTSTTTPENSALRHQSPRGCSPSCRNRRAASRDFIACIIRQASETDVQDGSKRFISRAALVDALTVGKVSSLLSVCPRDEDQPDARPYDAAAYISPEAGRCRCGRPQCTGARIIFVVLSLIAREEYVWDLVPAGICDADLPLSIRETRLVSAEDVSKHVPETTQVWTMDEKKLFCHFQWAMLSPYFESRPIANIEIRRFAREVCLPWCQTDTPQDDAGFQFDESKTVLKRVKISKHYHNLGGEDSSFALKSQRRPMKEWKTFENEVKGNARTLGGHRHIIPLLDAFSHAGLCYMLFPWSEGGSLDAFWKTHGVAPEQSGVTYPNWRTPAWVWEQCCGLAGALSFIHGYPLSRPRAVPQWHADIQPRNILCSRTTDRRGEPSYILQISDFEFSQTFKTPDSETSVQYPKMAAWYSPPEFRLTADDKGVKITLKWDVWCLACVYLEFLSWFAFGYEKGIEDFAKRRAKIQPDKGAQDALKLVQEHEAKFFRLVSIKVPRFCFIRLFKKPTTTINAEVSSAVVKNTMSVTDWWSKDSEWQGRMKGLISFIKDEMLDIDVRSRATSEKVFNKLSGIV